MIELTGVTKKYGARLVLDRVSLSVPPGESTALLGPSGCGKTTLLRIIAGLEGIDSGEVRLRGHIANDLEPFQRKVAMMFQSHALWPHLTVRQNVHLCASKAARARIDGLLESLGIGEIGDRYPHQISGGQARRASLARTLSMEADIVLLDEPFAHLGEDLADQAACVVLDCLNRTGATLIVAAHDLRLAHLLRVQNVIPNRGSETWRGNLTV